MVTHRPPPLQSKNSLPRGYELESTLRHFHRVSPVYLSAILNCTLAVITGEYLRLYFASGLVSDLARFTGELVASVSLDKNAITFQILKVRGNYSTGEHYIHYGHRLFKFF